MRNERTDRPTRPDPVKTAGGFLAGWIGVTLVGLLDWGTGTEISLSILYLLPIGLAVWFGGLTTGLIVAAAAAGIWLVLDTFGGSVYSHPWIPYWNAAVRFGFFVLTTVLLHRIRFFNQHLDGLVRKRTAALAAEIEQRQQAEIVVRESETRFRQLAENIKEVFWVSDPGKNEISYVSPGYEVIWGRKCESLYAAPRTWLEAIHPEDRARVKEAALTKQVSGRYDEVYRIVRPDGSMRWIQDRAFPVTDAAGKVCRLVGLAEDITRRKQMEKRSAVFGSLGHKLSAATQPENAARIIMDMASELFGWDAGYLHLYSAAEDLIIPILTVDTVEGRRAPISPASFTLDPSPLMRRVMAEGAQLINRPADPTVSVPLVPFGAAQQSASMMYVPIYSSGTVLGVLSIQSYTACAYSRDDLGLLQALADHCGDALQRIKLAAATRELAAIVENSGDAIFTKALDGTILSWNKGAERLYGYTAEEIKGRSLAVLIPPEHQGDLPAILERVSRGERMGDFETTRLRKNGSRIEVSINISPIRDAAGHVTGASVIARDITERKRLEREIADASQHEQRRLAHELHDHLGAYLTGIAFRMKALAEALDRHAIPEASAAHELVKLVNDGTDQVRNFARLIAPVEIANGGLAVALSRLGAEMETLFGIICRVEVAPDLPLLTDEQALQLYRIAQEAARNAVQHGKARNVEISVRHDPGQLVQTIRNDGQPWAPVKESGKNLGLRIMRYRAATLGGTLALQSDSRGQFMVVCQMALPPTGAAGPAVGQPALPFL